MDFIVTKDKSGKSGVQNLPFDQTCFLECEGKFMVVHTLTEQFYMNGTLAYWLDALAKYDFEKSDRNVIVNMTMIERIDPIMKIAYFETEIHKNSKYCTISWPKNYEKIISRLEVMNPNAILA